MKKFGVLILSLFVIPILASCKPRTYTVTWKNYDGTVLEVDEKLHLGDVPTYDGDELTREGGTSYSEYEFNDWDPKIEPIKGKDQVYVAQYKLVYNCEAYLKVHIDTADTQITITYISTGETPSIDWGDNTTDTLKSHTYTSVGDYEIKVHGNVTDVGIDGENKSCLKNLFLSPTVDEIEDNAYKDCVNLETVEFAEDSNAITSIGAGAFEGCTNLTSINIPESVSAIQQRTFFGCKSLNSITLHDNLTQIGNSAFEESGIVTVDIPKSVTVIAPSTFDTCNKLESVIIHGAVTVVGERAFALCGALKTVTFADSSQLTSIGQSAFFVCKQLKEIIIPISVTNIGGSAFKSCDNLTVYCEADSKPEGWASNWIDSGRPCYWGFLSKGVTSDGFNYFSTKTGSHIIDRYVGRATKVVIPSIIDGQPVISIANGCFSDNDKITSITFPSSLENIAPNMCDSCKSLTSVTIPNNIKTIGEDSFYGCDKLQHINFSSDSQLTTIGDGSFNKCKALQSISIPESVVTIEENVFRGCESLTSFYVPKNVAVFRRVIEECNNLRTIEVDSENTTFDSRNNCNAVIETATNKLVGGCKNSIIPDGVTAIEECVFLRLPDLTSITLPNTLKTIGQFAFDGCNLSSIIIPGSVTSIGNSAFALNDNLTIVDLSAFTDSGAIPTASNNNIFGNSVEKIYVNDETMLNAFKTATNWSRYADNYEVKPSI